MLQRLRFPTPIVLLLCALCGCTVYGACGNVDCADDRQVADAVRANIDRYPELRPPNFIYVQTHSHVVTLHGQVSTDYERETAEDVAMQTPGVVRVINLIGLYYTGR
jgi:osmotically-inducible protein OsmY